jgi:hypothetical protein
VDHDAVIVPDSGVVTAILPKAGREAEVLANVSHIPHSTAYRKENLPEHFHYKHNDRIMPIIVVADEGWTLSAVNTGLYLLVLFVCLPVCLSVWLPVCLCACQSVCLLVCQSVCTVYFWSNLP